MASNGPKDVLVRSAEPPRMAMGPGNKHLGPAEGFVAAPSLSVPGTQAA